MMSSQRRVTVVGAGRVGLVTSVGLAKLGNTVDVVEIDPARLAALESGRMPFFEPGLEAEVADLRRRGALGIRASHSADTEVALICVGTPIAQEGLVDLGALAAALGQLAPLARRGVPLVIRSTLPPGGTGSLAAQLSLDRRNLLTNPEFLSQGSALADFLRPPRIVIGRFAETRPEYVELLAGLFAGIDAPMLIVDVAAAELIKNAANAYLALRLSFVNEIASLCEEFGADAGDVMPGLALDPRIGRLFWRPSLGYGGSCLPNAAAVLARAGHERGLAADALDAVGTANRAQQARFAARVEKVLGGVSGRAIGLLGLAYKAGTDDVRDSPAVMLANRLMARGAVVRAYDPRASDEARREAPGIEIAGDALATLRGAEAAVIATDWADFAKLDWRVARDQMAQPVIIDGHRLLDAQLMRTLGFTYFSVGSPDDRLEPSSRTSYRSANG